jgi:hypothetical protein
VSTLPPEHQPSGDPQLVAPAVDPSPGLYPETVDTERIARDTAMIHVSAVDDDTAAEQVIQSHGQAETETPSLAQPVNVLAVVSLLLALTLSPLAAVFGYLAVGQIRRANQRGESLAWVAVGLGWLWLVVYSFAISVLVAIWWSIS